MALPAEHLVGRADEVGSLEVALDELDRGHRARSRWRANLGSARRGSSGSSPLGPKPARDRVQAELAQVPELGCVHRTVPADRADVSGGSGSLCRVPPGVPAG